MKIGVLTSSRADYGIYLSLLKRIAHDPAFALTIIAFGTHVSKYHGFTVDQIKKDGFSDVKEMASLLTNDDECSIATSFGLTALKFADFWQAHPFDFVFCLGDRFEMAAAVQAGIPFHIRFIHIHGGETTLGAIDNIYRHQITLASTIHFPATAQFAQRIKEITGTSKHICVVGSLSIDELDQLPIPTRPDFQHKFQIAKEFALLTFHPETADSNHVQFANEMLNALTAIAQKILLVITMPNADTHGTVFREALLLLKERYPDQVVLVENFGKLNYFAAMRYCKLLIGNTSSGIIEAASFGKYVVNVGNRQKGRLQSGNVMNVPFHSADMVAAFHTLYAKGDYTGTNVYQKKGTTDLILNYLKNLA